MTEDEAKRLCDLLLPGIVAVEHTLGLSRSGELRIDEDDGLCLDLKRDERAKTYILAIQDEVDSGAYRDTFVMRVRESFDNFMGEGGVTGVARYLEQRGPKSVPGADDDAGAPLPKGDS